MIIIFDIALGELQEFDNEAEANTFLIDCDLQQLKQGNFEVFSATPLDLTSAIIQKLKKHEVEQEELDEQFEKDTKAIERHESYERFLIRGGL